MSNQKIDAEEAKVTAEEAPETKEAEKAEEVVSEETEKTEGSQKAPEENEAGTTAEAEEDLKSENAEDPQKAPEKDETEEKSKPEEKTAAKSNVLKKAEAEMAALKEKMLRLQADFENYKRRSQKEKADVYAHAMESLMTKLLPVIDNLDRAEAAATDNLDSYREGVQMIFKSLLNVLNTEGLKEIESLGQAFDPNFHHGVAVGEDPEQDDQVVIEVFQKGYQFKDKVIRPAMVKVNQK